MPKKRETPQNSSAADFPETGPIDIDSTGAHELQDRATEKTKAEDRKRDSFATGDKRFTEGK